MILAGDLGGTKSNLAAFEVHDGKLRCLDRAKFASQEASRAEEIVEAFARRIGGKFAAACFGIAGPVFDNKVRATNLPWIVDGEALARLLGLQHVTLLNDMDTTFHGIEALEPDELYLLQASPPAPQENQALIAAGTGLGEAIRFWDGSRYIVMASEGGHADFAPRTDEEIELLRFLKAKQQWISWELILSGKGFREVHEFLDPKLVHPSFNDPKADAAADITHQALNHTCPVCVRALDLWADLYGAEAGNLALRSLARGGVFVAGGISAKLLPKLKDGRFTEAFSQKSKFGYFLKQVPITLVLNEDAPLLGAASVAAKAAAAAA
jgi:glucokinase